MRGFIFGVVVTLLVIFGGGYYYVSSGRFDTRAAGNTPGSFERQTSNKSVDAWVEQHAPTQANPFQPTMDAVMDGSMTYDKNCAFCHGSLKQPVSPMRRNFYPPVPQLMGHTPDDPDGQMFYVIKYGIRNTAMPGWDGVLSDEDIWKTVVFLKNSSQMKDNSQPQQPQNLQHMDNAKPAPAK